MFDTGDILLRKIKKGNKQSDRHDLSLHSRMPVEIKQNEFVLVWVILHINYNEKKVLKSPEL